MRPDVFHDAGKYTEKHRRKRRWYRISASLAAVVVFCTIYLLMMPGDKPFKTKEITSQIGSARLSFASAEDMEKYLDIEPGAVSVMGLMNDTEHHVRLLVDEDILKGEYLGCHPCVNTSSLRMRTADVFGLYLDAVEHDMTKVVLTGEA